MSFSMWLSTLPKSFYKLKEQSSDIVLFLTEDSLFGLFVEINLNCTDYKAIPTNSITADSYLLKILLLLPLHSHHESTAKQAIKVPHLCYFSQNIIILLNTVATTVLWENFSKDRATYPSCLQQLFSKLLCGVVES